MEPPVSQPPFGDSTSVVSIPLSGGRNHAESNLTSNATITKRKMKKRKGKETKEPVVVCSDSGKSSAASSCSSSFPNSKSKGIRLSGSRRNPRVLSNPVTQKQKNDADAIALPLGMSIAAFVNQVLERKDAAGEKMSVEYLSQTCTLAVKESLANVFGDEFGCFVSHFERSFRSTLMTLRVINESSENNVEQKRLVNKQRSYLPKPSARSWEGISTCCSGGNDSHFETKVSDHINREQASTVGVDEENIPRNLGCEELRVHEAENSQQLVSVSASTHHSGADHSMLSTIERSITEQTRSNDLKALEISLLMKKVKLKEAQIAINCDSNFLERFKLSLGMSKANFRAEKFKSELEESRHAELLKKCNDCLVAGLLIMVAGLGYGTYVYSHQRLIEATESCMPIKESNSWWIPKPMASFGSGFQILRCQVQVLSRMLFGVLMIVAITYLLIQRSGASKQTMPVTFILLLLGVGCGFAGKFCIDTLGGSGILWLFYWEVLCLVHFHSNICTSTLFLLLHGPIKVTEMPSSTKWFPYWMRRVIFYGMILLCLPLLCGLMPFAGPGEWTERFLSLITMESD